MLLRPPRGGQPAAVLPILLLCVRFAARDTARARARLGEQEPVEVHESSAPLEAVGQRLDPPAALAALLPRARAAHEREEGRHLPCHLRPMSEVMCIHMRHWLDPPTSAPP